MKSQNAREYLLPPSDSFWHWNSAERVAVWRNDRQSGAGSTIAFTQEIVAVLERFQPRGLPRLDCIMLLLAALRENWCKFGTNDSQDRVLVEYLKDAWLDNESARKLIQQLDRVHDFSKDFRESVSTKAKVVEMLLESLPTRCEGEAMNQAIQVLRRVTDSFPLEDSSDWEPEFFLSLDLRVLRGALEKFDESKIRHRLQTGIDTPLEIEEEVNEHEYSDASEARELIETLLQQSEHYALGRLAKDLLAALYRPARLSLEKTLHHEGYSDISNRGSLDRLLLSELAFDDEVLAVRIANGEALYMRRDVPPTKQCVDRCILIDSGIRSWGTPRIYSAAIAIALTAGADPSAKVSAWRTTADGLKASYFVDQSGLMEHLGALNAELHPGESLEVFQSQLSKMPPGTEAFLILSRDVWDDSEFRARLRQADLGWVMVAVVDRGGKLELLEHNRIGTRSQKQIQLTLVESQTKMAALPLLVPGRLPRILEMSPFPLRLTLSKPKLKALDRGLMLGHTGSQQLGLWDAPDCGAVILLPHAPKGELLACGFNESQETIWVVWGHIHNPHRWLFLFRRSDYALIAQTKMETPSGHVRCEIKRDVLIVSSPWRRRVQALSISDGKILGTVYTSAQSHGTVDQDEYGNWSTAYFDGLGFDKLPITFGAAAVNEKILFVTPPPSYDGFIALTESGKLLHSVGRAELIQLPERTRATVIPGTALTLGNNRWICFGTRQGYYALEISNEGNPGVCRTFNSQNSDQSLQELVWESGTRIRTGVSRNRFHSIGIIDGCLTLARMGRILVLHQQRDGGTRRAIWIPRKEDTDTLASQLVKLQYDEGLSKELGFRVETARAGGVEIMLDGRGLLHLRRLDSAKRELTLIIKEGKTSGWSSDGRVFGEPYYCGRSSIYEFPDEVLRDILEAWE